MATSLPSDIAESATAEALDDLGWPEPDFSATSESDELPGAKTEPDVFDGVGADDLVVESLESEPITLAISDLADTGADSRAEREVWAIERSPLDAFDELEDAKAQASGDAIDTDVETDRAAGYADYGAWNSAAAEESVEAASPEEVLRFSRDDESWGAGASTPFDTSWEDTDAVRAPEDAAVGDEPAAPSASVHELPALESDLPVPDGIAVASTELTLPGVASDATVGAELLESEEESAVEEGSAVASASDPWAHIDLPEPAFGSSGWPTAANEGNDLADWAGAAPVSELASPIAGEYSLGGLAPGRPEVEEEAREPVDEMSAALAWNEVEGDDDAARAGADAADAVSAAEDALNAVAHELRDTAAAWAPAEGERGDDLSDPRGRFAAVEDGAGSWGGSAVGARQEGGEEEGGVSGGEGAGSAIADALARVAERIRAGEVEMLAETAGASDESALAAALAALLRGPRRH